MFAALPRGFSYLAERWAARARVHASGTDAGQPAAAAPAAAAARRAAAGENLHVGGYRENI